MARANALSSSTSVRSARWRNDSEASDAELDLLEHPGELLREHPGHVLDHLGDRGVQRQAGLDADRQEVEGVGQGAQDLALPVLDAAVHDRVGRDEAGEGEQGGNQDDDERRQACRRADQQAQHEAATSPMILKAMTRSAPSRRDSPPAGAFRVMRSRASSGVMRGRSVRPSRARAPDARLEKTPPSPCRAGSRRSRPRPVTRGAGRRGCVRPACRPVRNRGAGSLRTYRPDRAPGRDQTSIFTIFRIQRGPSQESQRADQQHPPDPWSSPAGSRTPCSPRTCTARSRTA